MSGNRQTTATQVRPDESPEKRQALMLMGYLRWQNGTLAHASGDVAPLVAAAGRVALSTAEGIGNDSTCEVAP